MFLCSHKSNHWHTFVSRFQYISHSNWCNLNYNCLYKKKYTLQNNYKSSSNHNLFLSYFHVKPPSQW